MTTYDHIQELRAELAVTLDASERQQIEAELAAALQQLADEEAVFEAVFGSVPPE